MVTGKLAWNLQRFSLRILLLSTFNHCLQIRSRWKRYFFDSLQMLQVHWAYLHATRWPTFWKLFWHHLLLYFRLFPQRLLSKFSHDKILLKIWLPFTKVIIEKLDTFRHVTKFDVEANLLIGLSYLFEGLQLVFDIHLIEQIVQLLVFVIQFFIWVHAILWCCRVI